MSMDVAVVRVVSFDLDKGSVVLGSAPSGSLGRVAASLEGRSCRVG